MNDAGRIYCVSNQQGIVMNLQTKLLPSYSHCDDRAIHSSENTHFSQLEIIMTRNSRSMTALPIWTSKYICTLDHHDVQNFALALQLVGLAGQCCSQALHSNPTQVSTVCVATNSALIEWMLGIPFIHSIFQAPSCAHGLCDFLPFSNESQMKCFRRQSYQSIYFVPIGLPIRQYIYILSISPNFIKPHSLLCKTFLHSLLCFVSFLRSRYYISMRRRTDYIPFKHGRTMRKQLEFQA